MYNYLTLTVTNTRCTTIYRLLSQPNDVSLLPAYCQQTHDVPLFTA